MPNDFEPFSAEQMGEVALCLLRWAATFLIVGILAEFLISAFH